MPEPDLKRVDFDPYFLMWNSVLFYPNPENRNVVVHNHAGDMGSIPCHQHQACGALVKAETKYPPRVCPGCGVDTKVEQKERADKGETWQVPV